MAVFPWFAAFFLCPLMAASSRDLTGRWSGSIAVGGRQMPLVFELLQDGDAITGTCGVRPDFVAALTAARLSGSTIEFDMQLPAWPPASFAGTVEGDRMTGELKSSAQPLNGKLELRRTGALTRLPASLAPAPKRDDLAALSDQFDNAQSLKNWKDFSQAEGWPNRVEKMEAAGGSLSIVPRSGAWWMGYHGIYLFKEIKGDFVITTRLKVTGKEGAEPTRIWTISGLLVRRPIAAQTPRDAIRENWLYVMTGRGPQQDRVVDAKSTLDSSNEWDITPAKAGWYELRLARLGPLFVALVRPEGGEWALRKRILREDLPETVQAGINVTSDFDVSRTMPPAKYNAELFPASQADALAAFDYVRFARVGAHKLAGRELLRIPDAELLALLR